MRRALALAASVRTRTSPNPWVGAVVVTARRRSAFEGATAPPGGPHAEVVALAAAGDAGPRCDALHDPRALRPPRPHPAVHRRRSSPPGWPGWWWACSTPTPRSRAEASTRFASSGIDVDVGVARRRGRRAAGPLPEAPPHRDGPGSC